MSDMRPDEALKVVADTIDQVSCNGPTRRVLDNALRVFMRLASDEAARSRITQLAVPAVETKP